MDVSGSGWLTQYVLSAFEEQLLGAVRAHNETSIAHPQGPQLHGHPQEHHHHIDPAIASSGGMLIGNASADVGTSSAGDGRKANKRELANTKRAEQNRQAQVCLFCIMRSAECLSAIVVLQIHIMLWRTSSLRSRPKQPPPAD